MKNPIEYLIYWADKSPEKIAIQNTVSQFRYDELLDRVCKIAGKLKSLGIRPQQSVVLSMAEDHFRWIFSLALLHVGATLIGRQSFNSLNTKDKIDYNWIVSDKEMPEIPHNELIIINREFLSEIKNLQPDMDFYHYQANDPICIFGTSGTTGISKNVCWNL